MRRERFSGAIAGIGCTIGVRLVVGRWADSPLGAFADVMVAEPDGHRVLLAPSPEVAEFVSATYTFDRVELGPVTVVGASSWALTAPGLSLRFDVGRRTAIGHLLRAQPRRLATAPWWTHVTDPVARVLLPGVRTRGAAREGRREYYGATDLHRITAASGTWHDTDLGVLAPVAPDPRFGFGSTPRRPAVATIVTTVLLD